jgi:hypothetical protein
MNIEGSNNRQTTSGRWTELEHKKFLLGIAMMKLRHSIIREKLEENRGARANKEWSTNTIPRSKVFPKTRPKFKRFYGGVG